MIFFSLFLKLIVGMESREENRDKMKFLRNIRSEDVSSRARALRIAQKHPDILRPEIGEVKNWLNFYDNDVFKQVFLIALAKLNDTELRQLLRNDDYLFFRRLLSGIIYGTEKEPISHFNISLDTFAFVVSTWKKMNKKQEFFINEESTSVGNLSAAFAGISERRKAEIVRYYVGLGYQQPFAAIDSIKDLVAFVENGPRGFWHKHGLKVLFSSSVVIMVEITVGWFVHYKFNKTKKSSNSRKPRITGKKRILR